MALPPLMYIYRAFYPCNKTTGTEKRPTETEKPDENTLKKFDELSCFLDKLINTPNFLETDEGKHLQFDFLEDCKAIYEALITPIRENQQHPIVVTARCCDTDITLTEQEDRVVLEIGDHQRSLDKTTLTTLCEKLGEKFNDRFYIDRYSLHNIRSNWKGRLYIKEHPLPKSDKTQPYRSVTDNYDSYPKELNGKATFAGGTTPIVCADLVTKYVIECWNDQSGRGKASILKKFNSEEGITSNVSFQASFDCDTLVANAKSYALINNDQLGEYLCTCFDDMREKKEPLRTLLIESTNHAMAIRLRIKDTEENSMYVISFYDPHLTNAAMRCESSDLSTFQHHTLGQYITGSDKKEELTGRYDAYFPGNTPICLVREFTLASLNNTESSRELTHFPSGPLTATHMHLLLSINSNFSKYYDNLEGELRKIGEESLEKLIDLLAANSPEGIPGLFMALQNGYTQAIEAYGKLLQLIPESERSRLLDLLTEKCPDWIPQDRLMNFKKQALLPH